MIPADWLPHRRDDGEIVGYVRIVGEDFEPMDLFGRSIAAAGDWFHAESILDEQGIGWIAEPWLLDLGEGRRIRVRVTEVTPTVIRCKVDDFGAIDAPAGQSWELPVPETGRLIAIAPGTPHPGWSEDGVELV